MLPDGKSLTRPSFTHRKGWPRSGREQAMLRRIRLQLELCIMWPLVLSPPRLAMTPEEIRMSKAIRLPIRFLRSLTPDEVCTLVLRDRWLDEKQCARLWRMMGREDDPPYTVRVYVSRTDVDVLIEQIHAMALQSTPQHRRERRGRVFVPPMPSISRPRFSPGGRRSPIPAECLGSAAKGMSRLSDSTSAVLRPSNG